MKDFLKDSWKNLAVSLAGAGSFSTALPLIFSGAQAITHLDRDLVFKVFIVCYFSLPIVVQMFWSRSWLKNLKYVVDIPYFAVVIFACAQFLAVAVPTVFPEVSKGELSLIINALAISSLVFVFLLIIRRKSQILKGPGKPKIVVFSSVFAVVTIIAMYLIVSNVNHESTAATKGKFLDAGHPSLSYLTDVDSLTTFNGVVKRLDSISGAASIRYLQLVQPAPRLNMDSMELKAMKLAHLVMLQVDSQVRASKATNFQSLRDSLALAMRLYVHPAFTMPSIPSHHRAAQGYLQCGQQITEQLKAIVDGRWYAHTKHEIAAVQFQILLPMLLCLVLQLSLFFIIDRITVAENQSLNGEPPSKELKVLIDSKGDVQSFLVILSLIVLPLIKQVDSRSLQKGDPFKQSAWFLPAFVKEGILGFQNNAVTSLDESSAKKANGFADSDWEEDLEIDDRLSEIEYNLKMLSNIGFLTMYRLPDHTYETFADLYPKATEDFVATYHLSQDSTSLKTIKPR